MNLEDLCTRRVAVWGLGQEGTDLVGLLRGRGVQPLLVDDDPAGALLRAGTAAGGRPVIAPGDVDWSTVEVVVRAPGVSRYRPELRAAEAAGTTVTTAMAVWLADFADASVLAITGTKGKSTTAALAGAVLRAMGREVELVGNIGVPVTETYTRPRAGAYVVEVSSYQAVDVTTTPPVCVLTSLAPDHLDWHGGVEPYYRDKLHLLEAGPDGPSGSVAVNAASGEAVRRTSSHPGRLLYGPTGRVVADGDGAVSADGVVLVEAGTLGVPGRHNLWNVCGAISGVLLLEGRLPPAAAVAEAVAGFSGLPSRCQVVGRARRADPGRRRPGIEPFRHPGLRRRVLGAGARRHRRRCRPRGGHGRPRRLAGRPPSGAHRRRRRTGRPPPGRGAGHRAGRCRHPRSDRPVPRGCRVGGHRRHRYRAV